MSNEKMSSDFREKIIVSFISGKGAIGKSVILSLIARVLVEDFSKILIWDNDIFSPIQHFINNVEPNIRLVDVLENNLPINKALTKINERISLIGGGINKLDFNPEISDVLIKKFVELMKEHDFDIVFIDNHSGFSKTIVDFCKISSLNLMFLSDDPTSVLDAYGLTKILYKAFSINNIATIVNNVIDKEDGMEILKVFNLATTNFLKKEFPNVGIIYYEKELKKHLLYQDLFAQTKNNAEFIQNIRNISNNIINFVLKHQRVV